MATTGMLAVSSCAFSATLCDFPRALTRADALVLIAVDWFCRSRFIEPKDSADRDKPPPVGAHARLDIIRCDRSLGNRETCILYALNSFVAAGEDPEDFDLAAQIFTDEATEFIQQLSLDGDARSLRDAADELAERIRKFEKVRRGGLAVGKTRHPKRCPVVRRLVNGERAS